MKLDSKARYAESHEWARQEGDDIIVGISDYAQESLSDIVYVELPEVGDELERGDEFGVVESVKAASEVYAPVSGEVVAINELLDGEPEIVNEEPYGKGWFIRIRPDAPSQFNDLMSDDEYEAFVAEEQE
jgi:glycine cleavage system H protein